VCELNTKTYRRPAEDESRELLGELYAQVARPEFTYRHQWRIGDSAYLGQHRRTTSRHQQRLRVAAPAPHASHDRARPRFFLIFFASSFGERSHANSSMPPHCRLCRRLLACAAWSQDNTRYPERPIRLIVPFAPGGSLDIIGRILSQKLTDRMGQTVVVDNRAGGTAIIGTEILAGAPPNGYTMMIANIAHGANPFCTRRCLTTPRKAFRL
jgi:hypothetical protein